ncbi:MULTISPECIES: hypothetical protein [unclassified Streptomyces]|uniref:hypothetical protein n=1 Tax=unclassified Streptomyces TaxID=2593676 RepID=UPI00224F0F53|nr:MULTISPECIES: hypothetical protein [unclassified Streptomyces]MCX4528642.1 hypothetical protein [Streptomyces sp. NBC_01551]MCX4540751.1 hypothetical protein [Streptomyces sp. NBC_01565]
MSGDGNTYYGNVVNMHDGEGNTGMVVHGGTSVGPRQADPALERAVRELVDLLTDLRTHAPQADVRRIDEALPAITADPAAAPAERGNALRTVAGVAALMGEIGAPALAAARALLQLLGG